MIYAAWSRNSGHRTRTLNNPMASKILLATDFSDSAQLAQAYTEYLAVALKASVILLHVSEHPSSAGTGLTDEEIQTRLRTLRQQIGDRAVPVTIERSMGNAGEEILSAAHRLDADIIAMGMQGRTHVPYGLIGTTAQSVTTSGPCPVLTVPLPVKEASPCLFTSPEALRIQRILAPVDFSDPSLDSLECAIHFARRLQADLVLLHVLESAHADWDLRRMQGASATKDQWDARLETLARAVNSLGLSATPETRTGFSPDSILAAALQHRCDLIVMGTHGRGRRDRVNVGSVAEAVLRQAACPVLTVKNPKFVQRSALQRLLSKNSGAGVEKGGFDSHPPRESKEAEDVS